MQCPFCRSTELKVTNSRSTEDSLSVRRRRECQSCNRRFTTIETPELRVVKRSGVVEPFSSYKVISGVRKACQGRPVSKDDLDRLAWKVEVALRERGQEQIPAKTIGVEILGPLRDLDHVAYLRFASVYREFNSLEDFENEIQELRAHIHEQNPPHDTALPTSTPTLSK